jgi:hypothetical protein
VADQAGIGNSSSAAAPILSSPAPLESQRKTVLGEFLTRSSGRLSGLRQVADQAGIGNSSSAAAPILSSPAPLESQRKTVLGELLTSNMKASNTFV